jgi:hypothetical protein
MRSGRRLVEERCRGVADGYRAYGKLEKPMNKTDPSSKSLADRLSLRRETVRNLRLRTGVQTGGCGNTCGGTIKCGQGQRGSVVNGGGGGGPPSHQV